MQLIDSFLLHIQSDNGKSETEDGVDVDNEPSTQSEMLRRLRAMEAREAEMKREMNRLRALVDSRAPLPTRRPTAGADSVRRTTAGATAATTLSSGEDNDGTGDESCHDVEMDDHPPFATVRGIKRFFARSNQDTVTEI